MQHKKNRTFGYTLAFMIAILVVSTSGLIYTYFGKTNFGSLIQKMISVEISCKTDSYIASYFINADQDLGYLAINLIPVTNANKFDCETINIYGNEIDLSDTYIANWNSQGRNRPEKTKNHVFKNKTQNTISFNVEDLIELRAFGLIIPMNEVVINTEPGTWSTAIIAETTYENAKPPEVISPNEFSVLVDSDLVITEMNPPLSRGQSSSSDDAETFSMVMKNEEAHPQIQKKGSLSFIEDKSITHTKNSVRLFLKTRDPNFGASRDLFLLVFSTLFGVAIGGLIETFLAISLPRNATGIDNVAKAETLLDIEKPIEEEASKGEVNPPG